LSKAIELGSDRFEYNFVYSHDEFGKEAIKFVHSKFYDRRKYHWEGIIHEVLQGDGKTTFITEDSLKLEHYQNPETNRNGYLTGLSLDCYFHPENDRNSHYFARELHWSGRYKSAIKEFDRHIEMNKWKEERGQSMIFKGDSHLMLRKYL